MRSVVHHPCQYADHVEDQLARFDLDTRVVAHAEVGQYAELCMAIDRMESFHSRSLTAAGLVVAFVLFWATGRVVGNQNKQTHHANSYCL